LLIDGNTGQIINEIGETKSGTKIVKVRDLAFQPGTDILFGVGNPDVVEGSGNSLFTIDLEDAEVDVITSLDGLRVKGIAFDPNDATKLFAVNGGDGCFLTTLDPTGGSAVQTPVTETERCYDGLGIDADGQIFGTTRGDSLHLIDPSDGSDVTAAGVGENPSDVDFRFVKTGGGGEHEPPTIGKNYAGDNQVVPAKGIGIDGQYWTVTQDFNVDFELVQMLTSEHTISNTIYCNFGANTCNHITLSAGPYQEDINAALWKVSADKNFLGEITLTVDDPDDYLGVASFTSQIQAEKYWFTSFTIDFKKPMPGMMLGVQVWDTYGGVRNFYFNDGIEIIDTYGYPYVDTEFEPPLDVPRLCLSDDPDKRTSCAFAEKMQLEIERAEKLLT